jgi:hypothetical protein
MDIKAKLSRQQTKVRLAWNNYINAKEKNESDIMVKFLYARWKQLNFICHLWEEAVKRLEK